MSKIIKIITVVSTYMGWRGMWIMPTNLAICITSLFQQVIWFYVHQVIVVYRNIFPYISV